MSPNLEYKDPYKLIFPTISSSGYADEVVQEESSYELMGLFVFDIGYNRSNYADEIESDALLYVDPEDDAIIENYNRLEEAIVVYSPYGAPSSTGWYKVERAIVGEDKLLSNEIDNIRLSLKKTSEVINGD